MVVGSLARRYARAIMELAITANVVEKIGADLRGLAAAYKTAPELGEVLGNASFKKTQRR